jgi:protein-tyrosine phosphatase
MIDIHSHILYGIDDGAQSLDMSLQMLRLSAASGVTDIIATPHVNRRGIVPSWSDITAKTTALQQEADKAGVPIRIHAGAEVELSYDALQFIKEGSNDYCLAGSSYLLCELTEQSQPDQTEELLYQLMLKGFIPILAHPERYDRIMEHPGRVLEWMHNGILIQCNTGSFTGYFGQKALTMAVQLLEHHMVTFFGSDAHRAEGRSTDLREAADIIVSMDNQSDIWEAAAASADKIIHHQVLYPNLPEYWDKPKRGLLSRFFK